MKELHIKGILLAICLTVCQLMQAQDSLQMLKEDEFIQIVRSNHPVAKQGTLLIDLSRAQLLSVRGQFDPVFFYTDDQKTFDGKNYFNYKNAGLVIPAWFGVEVYAGFENNAGDRMNTELSAGKSSYAGISVPLLKNLVLDKRRATLQQAKLFVQQSSFERNTIINDLLLDAYLAYWNWARDYQLFLLMEKTIRINESRYELVKISFQQGDRAGIDTTEALTQLQTFQQLREQALLKFRESSLELSSFLWLNDNRPVYLSNAVVPDTSWAQQNFTHTGIDLLDNWLTQTISDHPKLQAIDVKLQAQETERKLKFQSLLPKLDLKYNFLQQGYNLINNYSANTLSNNYKFGLSAVIPVPNRSGIGNYRAAKIKLKSLELDRNYTRLNLENKVRFYYSEVINLQKQIRIYAPALENYIRLLDAEQLKFSLGETTLFFLNARESKVVEARQKLLELKAKFYQSFAKLNWASGQLQ